MQVAGNFAPLFRPGLRRDFRDSFQQWEPEYPQYLRTGNTTDPEQRATIMTGLNRLYERGDGEPIIYDDPKLGPIVVGVDKEFAAGFMITRRAVEDDKYGKPTSLRSGLLMLDVSRWNTVLRHSSMMPSQVTTSVRLTTCR